jgi:hypothetical protein
VPSFTGIGTRRSALLFILVPSRSAGGVVTPPA